MSYTKMFLNTYRNKNYSKLFLENLVTKQQTSTVSSEENFHINLGFSVEWCITENVIILQHLNSHCFCFSFSEILKEKICFFKFL